VEEGREEMEATGNEAERRRRRGANKSVRKGVLPSEGVTSRGDDE
jgi:hypothetical protein